MTKAVSIREFTCESTPIDMRIRLIMLAQGVMDLGIETSLGDWGHGVREHIAGFNAAIHVTPEELEEIGKMFAEAAKELRGE